MKDDKLVADFSKPLEDIFRICYCGHRKTIWQMRGKINVRGKGIIRTFRCPACGRVAKKDYLTEPTYKAIETREANDPQFYNSDLIRLNREMLGKPL